VGAVAVAVEGGRGAVSFEDWRCNCCESKDMFGLVLSGFIFGWRLSVKCDISIEQLTCCFG
jgi:hypothetical protein